MSCLPLLGVGILMYWVQQSVIDYRCVIWGNGSRDRQRTQNTQNKLTVQIVYIAITMMT